MEEKLGKSLAGLINPYRVSKGNKFRLKDIDPNNTGGLKSEYKNEAQVILKKSVEQLGELQEMLYAQDRWAVLLIFQAMDASGKDKMIKHVMSGINPQGVQVFSFKAPTDEEKDHDYLWRTTKCLPERGRIGIFNRSYYEEVLIVRVHPEILAGQKIPSELITANIWEERYKDIRNFELYLSRNGVAIRKFFLYISKKEQKKQFLERLDTPEKHWKFSLGDVKEREHWSEYMDAYEKVIRNTSTDHAPWFVVPSNNRWFARLVVAGAIVDAMKDLNLDYPQVTAEKRKELTIARKLLESENGKKQ